MSPREMNQKGEGLFHGGHEQAGWGGGAEGPLSAHKSSPVLSQVRCCPRGALSRQSGLCLGGDSLASRRPSDEVLRFPSSDWKVSQGWSGHVPLLRQGPGAGRVSLPSDLRLLKVPGPMPSSSQPLCPQTSGNEDNRSGGGELVSFLLGCKSIWQSPRNRKNS